MNKEEMVYLTAAGVISIFLLHNNWVMFCSAHTAAANIRAAAAKRWMLTLCLDSLLASPPVYGAVSGVSAG